MRKEIQPTRHVVQYYETDGMRIVHHSNYIRWMEESRADFLVQIGFPYEELEKRDILFPVLTVDCTYRMATTFGETVKIYPQLDWFDGLRYQVSYRIVSEDETVVHATGTTTHCFLNNELKPIRVKKTAPDVWEAFTEYAVGEKPPRVKLGNGGAEK